MKKFIYIFSWIVLGVLLSFWLHAIIEINYIKYYLPNGFRGHCALPLWLQIILPVLGIIFGFFAGKFFWKKIYVEKKLNRFLRKSGRGIYWAPRILAILFILFLTIFSLDVFDEHLGFWETVLALFVHNLPSIILFIILLVSWKRELFGGIVFILAGVLFMATLMKNIYSLIVVGPAFLIGILFLLDWRKKGYN